MEIVLLCAGTSSRMGKINKLLLPVGNTTIVANSAMQALKYLEKRNDGSTLIIVTGYRRFSTMKALKECRDYIEKTKAGLKAVIVYNKDYRKGQFSSLQTGVGQLTENAPFFVALADMPFITENHYKELENKLENYDAVRTVCNAIPGHPVLFNSHMKGKILNAKQDSKMSTVLQKYNVKYIEKKDASWISDIDTQSDFENIKKLQK